MKVVSGPPNPKGPVFGKTFDTSKWLISTNKKIRIANRIHCLNEMNVFKAFIPRPPYN